MRTTPPRQDSAPDDEFLVVVGAGTSSTLVIWGEAGIGKTVLLDYLTKRAAVSALVLRANGVESVAIDKTGAMTDDNAQQPEPGIPTERHFGSSNLFVPPEEDPRSDATSVGERATLIDFLKGCRQTLELKCQGLGAEQMARQSVPPSNMSLLGLVRHMADVERFWFRQVLSGEDAPRRYRTAEDRDADFNGARADPVVVNDAWDAWHKEVAFAEQCVEGLGDLGTSVPLPDEDEVIALREVLMHMVEEYARHCGHADLLRERIDGRVGV
jgi:uncharacterized damage-inducible protein DinB